MTFVGRRRARNPTREHLAATPVAAFDIGTNTLLCAVGRLDARGELDVLHDAASISRLGAGVHATGALGEEGIARALQTLVTEANRARQLGATTMVAAATAGVRNAANRDAFLHRLRRAVPDLYVTAVSGETEARLTFLGAMQGLRIDESETVRVVDIGGGSTEIVVGHAGGRPQSLASLAVGSVRHTEAFLRHDPPLPAECEEIRRSVRDALATVDTSDARPDRLVGVAATFSTMAAVASGMHYAELAQTHGKTISATALHETAVQLARASSAERAAIRGVEPERANVVAAGAMIADEVVAWSGHDEWTVSTGGVRIGLLLDLLVNRGELLGVGVPTAS